MMCVLMDDTKYDGLLNHTTPGKQTPMESWLDKPPSGSTNSVFVTCTPKGTDTPESYYFTVAMYMDSYEIDKKEMVVWMAGNDERKVFAQALNAYILQKGNVNKKKSACALASRSCNGYKTTRWYVGYEKDDDPLNIQIWVGDSTLNENHRANPYFRLYPNPSKEYCS